MHYCLSLPTNIPLSALPTPHAPLATPHASHTLQVMPADYGFRSGVGRIYQEAYGSIPTSAISLSLANFSKELRALRRSVLFDEYNKISDSTSAGPVLKVCAWAAGCSRLGGRWGRREGSRPNPPNLGVQMSRASHSPPPLYHSQLNPPPSTAHYLPPSPPPPMQAVFEAGNSVRKAFARLDNWLEEKGLLKPLDGSMSRYPALATRQVDLSKEEMEILERVRKLQVGGCGSGVGGAGGAGGWEEGSRIQFVWYSCTDILQLSLSPATFPAPRHPPHPLQPSPPPATLPTPRNSPRPPPSPPLPPVGRRRGERPRVAAGGCRAGSPRPAPSKNCLLGPLPLPRCCL
jgi:hypothetical protein